MLTFAFSIEAENPASGLLEPLGLYMFLIINRID